MTFKLEHILSILLVVIAIGGILYYGLDPQVAVRDKRNDQRKKDITNILNALHMYKAQSRSFPPDIAGKERQIGTCTYDDSLCSKIHGPCIDLVPYIYTYIAGGLPHDPLTGTAVNTRYSIKQDKNNIISVEACDAENGESVVVNR